jgi:hypothetical protein
MARRPGPTRYCAAGRVSCSRLLYTKPSTTTPHARGRSGTTRGSSATQPPVVFRPYPPCVVGAGSGRVPGPKFAAGTAAGAAGGFLGRREGQKFVGFCPLGGAHQSAWSLYTLCSAIHRAEGARRAWNSHLKLCILAQVAIARRKEVAESPAGLGSGISGAHRDRGASSAPFSAAGPGPGVQALLEALVQYLQPIDENE